MTPEELNSLRSYRLGLMRDAASMEKKPDRIPVVSFFVTWKILDSQYTLTEAMTDYQKMEEVVRQHQEKYNFDMLSDLGIRNAYRFAVAMDSPTYMINDEAESVAVHDINVADPAEIRELAGNYYKYLWEKGMPKKYPWWGSETSLAKLQNAFQEMMIYFGYCGKIAQTMSNEYGVPPRSAPNPYPAVSMENILGFLFGMKGSALLMRRDKEGLHALIDTMNALFFTPQLEALKKVPGKNMNYCFDLLIAMLAHNFMNRKQFEEFYWPYLKPTLDICEEKGLNTLIFTEGEILRFKDLLNDYSKGTITLLPENDDVFELRKEIPNAAIMGGMPCDVLGHATKEECIDHIKRVIDGVGPQGLMVCQNKMGSYRNDANPENLKAVNDFVREYQI